MFGWGKNNVEKEIEDKAISNDNKKTIEDSLTAFSFIMSKSSSRFFSLSFLESFTPSIIWSGLSITAAAHTGPASGPLPASSTPHMLL